MIITSAAPESCSQADPASGVVHTAGEGEAASMSKGEDEKLHKPDGASGLKQEGSPPMITAEALPESKKVQSELSFSEIE